MPRTRNAERKPLSFECCQKCLPFEARFRFFERTLRKLFDLDIARIWGECTILLFFLAPKTKCPQSKRQVQQIRRRFAFRHNFLKKTEILYWYQKKAVFIIFLWKKRI